MKNDFLVDKWNLWTIFLKIKAMFMLAPSGTAGYTKGPLKAIFWLYNTLKPAVDVSLLRFFRFFIIFNFNLLSFWIITVSFLVIMVSHRKIAQTGGRCQTTIFKKKPTQLIQVNWKKVEM